MGTEKKEKPSVSIFSRRTGIDRRWIPSVGYHPERRKGKDRRHASKRSFPAPIDGKDENTDIPAADEHIRRESSRTHLSKRSLPEKRVLLLPEVTLKEKNSDS